MHLIIQGRHLKVTPAINSYIKSKIKKTQNHFEGILYGHVVIETIRDGQVAEVTITSGHHHFHNKVKSEDLYKSIDLLFDKIERQVRRYKEYQQDKYKKQEKLTFHLQEIDEITESSEITIADLEIPIKPMNDLEAALQLNADKDHYVIGYVDNFDSPKPNYLEKVSPNHYNLIRFEDYWELKEAELINQNKIEFHSVSSLKPPIDSIEQAIDYLNHTEGKHRFFISMRTGRSMFLHKVSKNHFELVRETF